MTRTEIENLKVGDVLENTIDVEPWTEFKKLKPNARFSSPRKVVEISYRGVSVKGHAYVGGYMEFGPNSTISFSIGEDELMYRKVG
jgi:hypothetical protein